MSQTSPAPAAEAKPWVPPTADAEFKFEGVDSIPSWADKGWASWAQGPALALPAGDLFGTGPYHTKTARIGDTVKFVAATASKPARFEVIEGEPSPENSTLKVPQASGASLEDMLKTGVLTPDDLSDEAKGQVLSRSPGLKGLIEDGAAAPEAVPVSDLLKVA